MTKRDTSLPVTSITVDAENAIGPLELTPVERRETCVTRDFQCQVLLPAESVVMVRLEDGGGKER